MPYVDQASLQNLINFSISYLLQPQVPQSRIAMFLCPSEVNDQSNTAAGLAYYPSSYAANYGTWFAWNPNTGQTGEGAFGVSSRFRAADFSDSLSNSLGIAEAKTYQALLHDSGTPNSLNAPVPNAPADVIAYGGTFDTNFAHTQWVTGKMVQTGMTTTFAPNTSTIFMNGSTPIDTDFVSSRLGASATNLTYGAVTARNDHTGLVNILLTDGSVRAASSNVDRSIWRALGTRAGSEVVGDYQSNRIRFPAISSDTAYAGDTIGESATQTYFGNNLGSSSAILAANNRTDSRNAFWHFANSIAITLMLFMSKKKLLF